MSISASLSVSGHALEWAMPESKLWVATSSGDYAGMVEFSSGHFVSYDRNGRRIAASSSLPQARDRVRNSVTDDRRSDRIGSVGAGIVMAVSGASSATA